MEGRGAVPAAPDADWDDVVALLLSIDWSADPSPPCSPLADWQPRLLHDSASAESSDGLPELVAGDSTADEGASESASVLDESSCASHSGAQTSAGSTDGSIPSRRRKYREKKKSEMRELRELAVVLTDKVAAMEKRVQVRGGSGRVNGWRGVVLRQMQRRREVEALNRELRAQICRHRDLALQLIDTLRARATQLSSPRVAALLCPEQSKPVVLLNDSDWRLIDTFRREMAAMPPLAGDVLRDANMPKLAPGRDHAILHGRRRDHATGSEYGEVAEVQVVPFALADAVYALDKALPLLFGRECKPALIPFSDSPHDFAAKFQFRGSADARWDCVFVTRSVEVEDHWELVWRTLSTKRVPTAADPAMVESFLEEGWGTARALPSGWGSQSTGTILEFCSRSRLLPTHSSASEAPDSARLGEYLQELVSAAPEDAVELSQTMENVLVDEMAALSLARRSNTGSK